jgi:hypothetical protein
MVVLLRTTSVAAPSPAETPSPPAYSESVTPCFCPDLVGLAQAFTKNKAGFTGRASAPYSLIKPYVALSFVKGQSFVPSAIRHTVPFPCLVLGPFTSSVKGALLSCTCSTDPSALARLKAVSAKWHLNISALNMLDAPSFVYKTTPGALSLPAADRAVGDRFDALQPCGSFTGQVGDASHLEFIHAQLSYGQGKVVSKFISASLNHDHGIFKAFFGQKDIYRDSSDCLHLDADALHDFAREAPCSALYGIQFVRDDSGVAAVVRASCVRKWEGKSRVRASVKLPLLSSSNSAIASLNASYAQMVTLSTPYFRHSCHVGFGFKFKNAASLYLVYF